MKKSKGWSYIEYIDPDLVETKQGRADTWSRDTGSHLAVHHNLKEVFYSHCLYIK